MGATDVPVAVRSGSGQFARRVLRSSSGGHLGGRRRVFVDRDDEPGLDDEAPDRSTTTAARRYRPVCAGRSRRGGPPARRTERGGHVVIGDERRRAGLVLNCVYAAQATTSCGGFVQREGFGRAGFEESRAATAEATSLGSAGYWVPSKQQALVLDGEDLVAVRFLGVEVDQATAERVLSDPVERRRVGAS